MAGEDGTTSVFNEAVLKMQRIHECQRIINSVRSNLLAWNFEYGKYNYEVYSTQILNLFGEVMAKLNKKEFGDAKTKRKEMLNALESSNIISRQHMKSFGNPRVEIVIDRKGWEKLRDTLLDCEDYSRNLIDKHGMATPNEEEQGGFD